MWVADAQLPNEHLVGVTPGGRVYVDLQNAKLFEPQGTTQHRSDELAVA